MKLFYLLVIPVLLGIFFLYDNAYATSSFSGWVGACASGTKCDTTNHVTTGLCTDCTVDSLASGTDNGQFLVPQGVAVDKLGNFYVVDSTNRRVEKFNSAGAYQLQFGSNGTGIGQFFGAAFIALDKTGNVYVADHGNNRVDVFSSAGVYKSQFGPVVTGAGTFLNPWGIAFDSTGNIYVSYLYNQTVIKFNSAGAYQSQFGSVGTGDGQFSNPFGIAINNSTGDIYVVDSNRVEKFNSAGVYQSQFGSFGTGDGQLNLPAGLAIDKSGNVYVADSNNGRIEEFSPSGGYISQFSTSGSSNPGSSPYGIALDSTGNFYVSDSYYTNNIVEKFLSTGSTCSPPGSTDWTISSSCTLASTSTAPANVIVNSGAVLTIPSGMTLTVHFKTNHLIVHQGGGVLVKSGGKLN